MLAPSIHFESGMTWAPPVTVVLILACAAVFGAEFLTGAHKDVNALIRMGALSLPEVKNGAVWRLLSAAFLHASQVHLIGNMSFMFVLGMGCEHAFGKSRFLFLVVATAIAGSAVSLPNGKVSVGASGVLFGLAGALAGMLRRQKHFIHVTDYRIAPVIAFWAAFEILCGFFSPFIDNFAHIGGFVSGLAFGLTIEPQLKYEREEFSKRFSTVFMLATALACLLATAIFFVPRLIG
jgi:rhomboid protease GluP